MVAQKFGSLIAPQAEGPPSQKKQKQKQESLVVAVMLHEAEVTCPRSSSSRSLKCPEDVFQQRAPPGSICGEGAAKRARLPWKGGVVWRKRVGEDGGGAESGVESGVRVV